LGVASGDHLREAELGLRGGGCHTVIALESPLQSASETSAVDGRHEGNPLCKENREKGSKILARVSTLDIIVENGSIASQKDLGLPGLKSSKNRE